MNVKILYYLDLVRREEREVYRLFGKIRPKNASHYDCKYTIVGPVPVFLLPAREKSIHPETVHEIRFLGIPYRIVLLNNKDVHEYVI